MIDETLLDAIDKMDKAVEHAQHQFSTVRTGRASPSLVERLHVNYYGSDVPLQQLATFQVPEARQLVIKPHDRNTMTAIEKAIRDSDLGVSPSNDGVVIRLNLPALTEQRRKEYVKVVKHLAEEGRVAVRNLRRDARSTSRRPRRPVRSPPTSSSAPRKISTRSPTTTWMRSTRRCTARSRSSSKSDHPGESGP